LGPKITARVETLFLITAIFHAIGRGNLGRALPLFNSVMSAEIKSAATNALCRSNPTDETGYARAIFINNDGVQRAERRTAWSRIGDRFQGIARKRDSKR
jgi:hypothetical protein